MSSRLPAGWTLQKLGDLLDEKTVRVADLPIEERAQLEVLSLTKNRGLIPQSERFEKRVATENVDKYKVVRQGWIVYNPYVIWEGAIHALRRAIPGLVSPVYAVWSRNEDDGGFLDYVLRSPQVIASYQALSSGAVNRRRSIKKEDFLNITVPCPEIADQRAIAAVLNQIRSGLTERERLLRLAVELKEALVDDLMSRGLGGEMSVPTEAGPAPSSWQCAQLGGYLTDKKYGLSAKGAPTGSYPMLRMTNQQFGKIVADDLQYVELTASEFAKFALRRGDILFNRTNSYELVGRTALFDLQGDYVFASYLVRLRTDESRLRPAFLTHYLTWAQTQRRLKSIATKAIGQSNISATRLSELVVAIPPTTQEQDEIIEILRHADAKIEAHRRELAVTNELLRATTAELLRGGLSVASHEVESAALVEAN